MDRIAGFWKRYSLIQYRYPSEEEKRGCIVTDWIVNSALFLLGILVTTLMWKMPLQAEGEIAELVRIDGYTVSVLYVFLSFFFMFRYMKRNTFWDDYVPGKLKKDISRKELINSATGSIGFILIILVDFFKEETMLYDVPGASHVLLVNLFLGIGYVFIFECIELCCKTVPAMIYLSRHPEQLAEAEAMAAAAEAEK